MAPTQPELTHGPCGKTAAGVANSPVLAHELGAAVTPARGGARQDCRAPDHFGHRRPLLSHFPDTLSQHVERACGRWQALVTWLAKTQRIKNIEELGG